MSVKEPIQIRYNAVIAGSFHCRGCEVELALVTDDGRWYDWSEWGGGVNPCPVCGHVDELMRRKGVVT